LKPPGISPGRRRTGRLPLRISHGSRAGLVAGSAAEREEIRALIGSPNQVEAVTARFEKRAPVFGEI
jgi:hypothetical protein